MMAIPMVGRAAEERGFLSSWTTAACCATTELVRDSERSVRSLLSRQEAELVAESPSLAG